MKLSRAIRCFAALVTLLIAGAWAAAPALAHARHSHLGPHFVISEAVAAQITASLAPEAAEQRIQLALADIPGTGDPKPEPVLSLGAVGTEQGSPAACGGYCCAIHSSPCCSFAPPSGTRFACPLAATTSAPLFADEPRDGLPPESLLRPPKILA